MASLHFCRALLGEADTVPPPESIRGVATIGRAGQHRAGLGISRPGSPDQADGDGRGGGQAGAAEWEQQLQANRLDFNQVEIERRDEEIANIERTVDGACHW